MSPRFVLGRENVPCVAEVVNRSLKADCTNFIGSCFPIITVKQFRMAGVYIQRYLCKLCLSQCLERFDQFNCNQLLRSRLGLSGQKTNRNLKQISTIECTETVIFQLLQPLDISKLAKKELIQ